MNNRDARLNNYIAKFQQIIKEHPDPYVLTTTGFSSVSLISAQSYACFLRKNWYDFLKEQGQFERLLDYAKEEYIRFCEKTNRTSVQDFVKEHRYLTQDFAKYVGNRNFKKSCGYRQIYNADQLRDNFFQMVDKYNRIPNQTEFTTSSEICIGTYKQYFGFKHQIWLDIVKQYVTDEGKLNEFHEQQKTAQSIRASKAAQQDYIYSNDFLEEEFRRVFDSYYDQCGVYPSRRLFNSVSVLHDLLYRQRFNKPWLQICKMYGYEINVNDKFRSETIALQLISEILNTQCERQKTFDWLLGNGNGSLRIDGYYPEYNLAVEYDGSQHRIPVSIYGGAERFKITVINDRIKNELLAEHGIALLRIRSDNKWFDKEFLLKELKAVGIIPRKTA